MVDRDGSVVITGKFHNSINLGDGPKRSKGDGDVFVVRLDPTGAHVWSHTFGGTDDDAPNAMAIDGDGNVVVTGTYYGTFDAGSGPLKAQGLTDAFVVSYDRAGAVRWAKTLGGNGYDTGIGVATDAKGNVMVTGNFKQAADMGGGRMSAIGFADAYVAVFGADGAHKWSRQIGGPVESVGWKAAFDGDGNALVLGGFRGTIDAAGTKLKCAGGQDMFLVKYDAAGQQQWAKQLGGPDDEYPNGIATGPRGEIALTGHFVKGLDFGGGPLAHAGTRDAFVAKLDATGNHLWSRAYGGTGKDEGSAVAIDTAGNVTLVGSFEGSAKIGNQDVTSRGATDAYVLRLGTDGTPLSTLAWGSPQADKATDVSVDASGLTTVAGELGGDIDFGPAGKLRRGDGQNGFLVRLPR